MKHCVSYICTTQNYARWCCPKGHCNQAQWVRTHASREASSTMCLQLSFMHTACITSLALARHQVLSECQHCNRKVLSWVSKLDLLTCSPCGGLPSLPAAAAAPSPVPATSPPSHTYTHIHTRKKNPDRNNTRMQTQKCVAVHCIKVQQEQ